MNPLVLFTDRTDLDTAPAQALLEDAGYDTVLADLASDPTGDLPDGAGRAVAVVVGFAHIDGALLDRLPHVRCIATMSVGTDMVDLQETERRGIRVLNLVGPSTEEVAAHALMLTLAVERNLRESLAVSAAGGWTDDVAAVAAVPRRLSGLTLGLYGFGRIARRFAEIAAPVFGKIIAHDPYVTDAPDGVTLVGAADLLEQADVLSLHLPVTAETGHIIDADAISRMRRGSVLVNVSRGDLVDQAALTAALDSGQLSGAGLDVLVGEPPAPDDPLRTDPRVLVTPHTAFLSDGSLQHYLQDPARNVLEWMREHHGEP